MNFNKSFSITLLMLSVIVSACSPKIADKLAWQNEPVIVDGQASEYPNFRYYDNASKLFYSFSNDRSNLYICVKTSDDAMQMKIIKAGMEIWIDTTAKPLNQSGILFPLANITKLNPGRMQAQMNNEGRRPDKSNMKQNFFLGQTYMQLVGFKNAKNGLSHLEDKSGIKVRLDWDSTGTMIYEAAVPFKTFFKESLLKSDSSKAITLTVNVNAIEMPKMPMGDRREGGEGPGGGDRPEGGMQGGGGMQGEGGMHGGAPHGGNSMGNNSAMTGKNTFAKKFRLAVKGQ